MTSCFSHENAMHLAFNGFTYYFMAPTVLAILGNVGFLGLYLGGRCMQSRMSDRTHHLHGRRPRL